MIKVSQLAIYPVKSCGQISLTDCELDRFGLNMDRRWMLVDENGKFLSQRLLPRMCLIMPTLLNVGVLLDAPKMPSIEIKMADAKSSKNVIVWGDNCTALDCGDLAANWLTKFLEKKCRLVFFPDDEIRQVDQEYALPNDITAFSDGFPFLLTSEASLEELNHRIQQTNSNQANIEMRRFRPNIVVSGCEPFAEDNWSKIQIGEILLRIVKPCSRCVIPSINPESAIREDEPTKTLKTFRRGIGGQSEAKWYFGQNVIAESLGQFEVGMPIKVLE